MNHVVSFAVSASLLVALAACSNDETSAPADVEDAATDARPDTLQSSDAGTNATIRCSSKLNCMAQSLESAPECPDPAPDPGTTCNVDPQKFCYYCEGAPETWSLSDLRRTFTCFSGQWVDGETRCGALP